jgi:predicted  nucleic acid-binding Zn-ribbon protein
MECGKKFATVKAAEYAAQDGCPKCGSVDIDLDTTSPRDRSALRDITALWNR